MKLRYKEQIGEFEIVRFFKDAEVDLQKTKARVRGLMPPDMNDELFEELFADGDPQIKRLFEENTVYLGIGPEADLVEDGVEAQQKEILAAMGEHKKMLTSGECIDDFRGVEYWRKPADKWLQEKIEHIGEPLPPDAVKQEELNGEQQREIDEQQKAERFDAMTPEEQAEYTQRELEGQLAALDREYLTPRVLAGLALGDSYAMEQAQAHEQHAAPLRAGWKAEKNKLAALRGEAVEEEEGE